MRALRYQEAQKSHHFRHLSATGLCIFRRPSYSLHKPSHRCMSSSRVGKRARGLGFCDDRIYRGQLPLQSRQAVAFDSVIYDDNRYVQYETIQKKIKKREGA